MSLQCHRQFASSHYSTNLSFISVSMAKKYAGVHSDGASASRPCRNANNSLRTSREMASIQVSYSSMDLVSLPCSWSHLISRIESLRSSHSIVLGPMVGVLPLSMQPHR